MREYVSKYRRIKIGEGLKSFPIEKKEKYNIAIYLRNYFKFKLLLASEGEKLLKTVFKKKTILSLILTFIEKRL